MAEETVVIRRFRNEAEAQLARSLLEANGVGSILLSDTAAGLLGAEVRLAVNASDAEEAIEILGAGDG